MELLSLVAVAVLLAARGPSPGAGEDVTVRMSTTTSTENSGLLDVLLPPFEKRYGVKVHVIAVGTGKALKLGENGDVDVVFVHDRESEERFVTDGSGVNRRDVMYNDFVVVGPAADPAGLKGVKDAAEALKRVSAAKATFISRGDGSGTHKKEKSLWKAAGIAPEGDWYREAGQGMGAVLMMASEKKGYALSDRGMFDAMREKVGLAVLCEGDVRLFNPYSVIPVNPARHPKARYVEAMMLTGWLTSPEGQRIIGEYRKGGQILFVPSALHPGSK
jgi:tungstate transport system substrate-binding protein